MDGGRCAGHVAPDPHAEANHVHSTGTKPGPSLQACSQAPRCNAVTSVRPGTSTAPQGFVAGSTTVCLILDVTIPGAAPGRNFP